MVNLVRLTSRADTADFNASFDDGIHINENASIALQNLTCETIFQSLSISNTNNVVSFQLDGGNSQNQLPTPAPPAIATPFSTVQAILPTRTYLSSNYNEFFSDLEGALNSTLTVGRSVTGGDIYSEFKVDVLSDKDRPKIYYKYSPMQMWFNMNEDLSPRDNDQELFGISQVANLETLEVLTSSPGELGRLGNITQVAAGNNTVDLVNYIYPFEGRTEWSHGSGMMMSYVYNLTNSGPADSNGFGMGLSFGELEGDTATSTVLKQTNRDFEILIETVAGSYRYITPDVPNTEQTPSVPVIPHSINITTDTNLLTHDRILFERSGGNIIGSILTTENPGTPGKKYVLFSYKLPDADRNKTLRPYIWVKGSKTNCEVGFPVFTPHVLQQEPDGTFTNLEYEITGKDNTFNGTTSNAYSELASGFEGVLPIINNARMDFDYRPYQIPNLTLNGAVLRFLGWSHLAYPGESYYTITTPETDISPDMQTNNECGFIIQGTRDIQVVNSDNYVLVLDSNPLMSYDASRFSYGDTALTTTYNNMRGRRLNILATIPINNNTGMIEFDSKQLVYIDFDNKFPQDIKNLRLRLLTKNLQPVNTTGQSVLTLLIKPN